LSAQSHFVLQNQNQKNNIQKLPVAGSDFAECDLTNSVFDNCDLINASFDHTNLEKVDFRTPSNYSFDPEINRIRRAKFSIDGVSGLLGKYDIDIER
jgi:uncharacterized protein YjbI with pentapeptide repeats